MLEKVAEERKSGFLLYIVGRYERIKNEDHNFQKMIVYETVLYKKDESVL